LALREIRLLLVIVQLGKNLQKEVGKKLHFVGRNYVQECNPFSKDQSKHHSISTSVSKGMLTFCPIWGICISSSYSETNRATNQPGWTLDSIILDTPSPSAWFVLLSYCRFWISFRSCRNL